ncbi:sensor histidine kinase [Brevibacterium samyangense]|uniref:histidine kinase n=1 Tax=Brevibacterium samyangense TaxID=366888 RepID=A0ABP5EJQ2_9MICO
MDATAAAQGHIWTVDVPEEPLTVHGDRRQLAQLVTNLLSNARKHTPTGTRVAVRLEEDSNGVAPGLQDKAGDEPAQIVRLTVEDDGPGISPELLPNLFERFVRRDTARTTTEESTGLGLSIVRSVARAHGGTARWSPNPGAPDSQSSCQPHDTARLVPYPVGGVDLFECGGEFVFSGEGLSLGCR